MHRKSVCCTCVFVKLDIKTVGSFRGNGCARQRVARVQFCEGSEVMGIHAHAGVLAQGRAYCVP